MDARVVTLHRSRRAIVLLAARAVLLPVCVAILGQNLVTVHDWSLRTWIISALLAAYVVGAFVELARSFGPTDIALVDRDLVVFAPTLLRQPVRLRRDQIVDARVTPRGWFGYRGRLPYVSGDTGALTPDRPDLGGSIRAVITFDTPIALSWWRIQGLRGDLFRGRSMPRATRRLVLSAADRDIEPLRALFDDFLGAPASASAVMPRDRTRDISVACARITAAAVAVAALLLLPHGSSDPLRALRPGVCLDPPGAAAFDHVDVLACSSPHTAEVVGATHNAELAGASENDCVTEYAIYAGDTRGRAAVHVQVIRDGESSDGVCVAILPRPVTYSLHGADGTTI